MKRSRYTATVQRGGSNPERRVILAHFAGDVRAHYERMGYTVLSVTKGDYRKQAQRRSASGARPIAAAVKLATAGLGLTLPVRVTLSNRQGGCAGHHKTRPTGAGIQVRNGRVYGLDGHDNTTAKWEHHIMVKDYLSAAEMGRTLWHELCHAMQFERDHLRGNEYGDACTTLRAQHASYRDGTTYIYKRQEVEARSYESRNDDMPLAR